jgi:hypothetical protein
MDNPYTDESGIAKLPPYAPHSFKRKSLKVGLSVKNSAMNARRKEPTVKARMGPTAVRNAKSMMVSKWCRKLAST